MLKEKDFKVISRASGLERREQMYFPMVLWAYRTHQLWFTHTYNNGCCQGFVASLSTMLSIHNVML